MYAFIRRILFLFPAERVHHFAFFWLRAFASLGILRLFARRLRPRHSKLSVSALGLQFPSPIGLAAGFDKNAEGYEALGELGFGFVEVGTVTAEPQPGNPKPRLFRLPGDRAVINRMGFNNLGARAMLARVTRPRRTILGINIGKTKLVPEQGAIADYVRSTELLAPYADYLVVNVSSPNTPGLRDLQAVEKLRPLLRAVQRSIAEVCPRKPVPLLVKIAPDLSDDDIDRVADLAVELGLDGIIATNTTISRDGLRSDPAVVDACGAGGLSGAPLKARALEVLVRLRQRLGPNMVLIGVGGIEDVDDILARLEAGADLVQLYSGFIYGGPTLPSRLNDELARRWAN